MAIYAVLYTQRVTKWNLIFKKEPHTAICKTRGRIFYYDIHGVTKKKHTERPICSGYTRDDDENGRIFHDESCRFQKVC